MNLFLTSICDSIKDIEALKQKINRQTKLVVLPFAHDFDWLSCAEDVWEKYSRDPQAKNSIFYKTVKPFINIGIDIDNIVIINRFTDPIPLIKHKLLADNTIIYLPGGRPENIMKILKALTLTETIKKCKNVVGESAGAMIWSKYFFVYPDNDYPKYRKFKGLGVTKNCVFIPHYKIYGPKEHILKATRRFTWFCKDTVYLTQDGGWIFYNTEMQRIHMRYDAIKHSGYMSWYYNVYNKN